MSGYSHRLLEAARLHWKLDGTAAAMQLLPQALRSKTAATLLSSAYASSTQGNYQRLWEKLQTYCIHVGLQDLPASLSTVAAYLGYICERGSVRRGSIRAYLAAIAAKHRMHGHTRPTADGQVAQIRRGFRTGDARRADGPPQRSAPLPASVASYALTQALAATSSQKQKLAALG